MSLNPNKYATVVIPAAYTPRWLQICVSSFAKYKNEKDFNILVMNNSPDFPMIEAISQTELIGHVDHIAITPYAQDRGHGLSLDYAIELVNTPFFFATETDGRPLRDGWLDWFAAFMKDDEVAMAGWLWEQAPDIDDGRKYISPGGTLYNTKILKLLKRECQRNKSHTICYGANNLRRHEIEGIYHELLDRGSFGPFTDCRGFHNLYPINKQWKEDWWWHEPGSWCYFRALCQWECVKVPGAMVYHENPHVADYTYYGDKENPWFYHQWAGTVSHNFDKHLVGTPWEIECIEWWLRREYRIWEEVVPENVRQVSIEKGLVKNFDDELAYALSRVQR